jgi:hypothetical protein
MVYAFCAVLGGAVLTAIFAPLFRKEETLESAILEETQWDLLQRRKEVVLGNVQDLDFEYKCGKLSDADYQKIRAEMMAEAAHVLDDIDKLEASLDLDALIRREVAARRDGRSKSSKTLTCSACGEKNPISNKFCADCGAKLTS